MVKEEYESLIEFQNTICPDRLITSNEGIIYFKGDFVYKIFDYSNLNKYYTSIRNIKKLSKLDEGLFTIPHSLIYIGGNFVGFKMRNLGVTLLDKYLKDGLSFEEKKLIAYKLKDIAQYLNRKRLVHFDIHLNNILYLDQNVRLTDVNGMMHIPHIYCFKKEYSRILELYYYWLTIYGAVNLDYIEINFCMHILFNTTQETLKNIFNDNRMSLRHLYALLDCPNTAFESDVFDEFNDLFNRKKKGLTQSSYLIDHLK